MTALRKPAGGDATRVAMLAVAGRSATLLGMVVERFLGDSFVLADADRADLAIIDRDAVGGAEALGDWRHRHPDAPVLLLSVRPGDASAGVVDVRMPIDAESFVEILKGVRVSLLAGPGGQGDPGAIRATPSGECSRKPPEPRMPAKAGNPLALLGNGAVPIEGRDYCGSADDLPARGIRPFGQLPSHEAIRLYFDPEAKLLGLLRAARRRAVADGRATRIGGLESPFIVLPGEPVKVVSPVRDEYLRALCTTSLFTEAIEPDPRAPASAGEATHDCDALLWKVALWTARGRLPCCTDPHRPVRLRCLPDFARLTATPYAEAICRRWLEDRDLSPAATAAQMEIPQRYVFALYSAAHLLDLTEPPHGDRCAPGAHAAAGRAARPSFDPIGHSTTPTKSTDLHHGA